MLRPSRFNLCRPFSTWTPPDMNTPVEVAEIRLSKPKKKPRYYQRAQEGSWSGLDGLEKRTSGSLIKETLKEMETDEEFKLTAKRLKEQGAMRMTLEEKKQRRRALDALGVPDFTTFVASHKIEDVEVRDQTSILQINVGLYCNQACNHCHVESSPKRKEMMTDEVADQCLRILADSPSLTTLDITGGAPELNPSFRRLVLGARQLLNHENTTTTTKNNIEIIDRCNLTVLSEPGQEDLAEFLAEHKVRVVASLPCYSAKNVDTQRGKGVFERSIVGLRKLNDLGYGVQGSGLHLDLVYNPLGAFLPPHQDALENKYKEELLEHFGVTFNQLFTMTNMPIKRFADFLFRRGELQDYMELLVRNFNFATTENLMCKNTISINYDGAIFDCDFNQQLQIPVTPHLDNDSKKIATSSNDIDLPPTSKGLSIFDIQSTSDLLAMPITHDNHCFGCTAGMGSS